MAGKGKGKAPAAEAGTSNGAAEQPTGHLTPSEERMLRVIRAATAGQGQPAIPAEVRAKATAGAAAQADMVEAFDAHINAIQAALDSDEPDSDKLLTVSAEAEKGAAIWPELGVLDLHQDHTRAGGPLARQRHSLPPLP